MKTIKKLLTCLAILFLLIGCRDTVSSSTQISGEWLIPQNEVLTVDLGRMAFLLFLTRV